MSARKFTLCCLTLLGSAKLALAVFPPPLPTNNPASVFNVTNYGAVGDGVTNNAAAIQAAIQAATAAPGGQGGIVEIPAAASPYLSGPLTMRSLVNLQIDSGATLMMLPYGSFPGAPAYTTPFINGSSLHDVTISGSGTIDGQGAAWWGEFHTNGVARPNFINFSSTTRLLIQDVRLQNPPTFHLMLKGNNKSITIQRIDIDTDPSSPNTDGMDLGSTNVLIQNCHINDGDDNIEIGGSTAAASDITVTNCMFGHGHGVSIGSLVQGGVSNITVINCTFTNTDYGIRMKAAITSGGIVQGLNYYNLTMTNLLYTPLLIYSFYPTPGSPTDDGITPQRAASTNVVATNSLTPIWRNIVISNVVATAGQPGMIWARAELPASNILLSKFNVTASDSANSSFKLYSVRGVQVVDCQFQGPGGTRKFDLFNAGVTFSNTSPAAAISLNGFAVTNPLAFYNQPASLTDATIFDANALSLGGSTLSNGTSLTLASTTLVNFTLGTNAARAAATGNLTLSNTLNITNGFGFGAGTYTLFTYTGSFSGSPSLGTTPAGYNYSLTNGAGKVNLVVTLPCVNPTATVSGGGTVCGGSSANIQAALTGTGPWNVTWSDGVVQSGVGTTPAVRSVSPAMTTNYTVTSLSDATGCPTGTINGSATVTVCVIAPFQITSANLMSPDQFVLTWDSLSNLTYQVQSSDSISPAVWTTDAVMTALGPALSWTNTGVSTAPRRFYRVVYIP